MPATAVTSEISVQDAGVRLPASLSPSTGDRFPGDNRFGLKDVGGRGL